jgi:hypothetical protein
MALPCSATLAIRPLLLLGALVGVVAGAHSIPPWATLLIHGKSLAKNWRRFAGLFPSLLSEFPILPKGA